MQKKLNINKALKLALFILTVSVALLLTRFVIQARPTFHLTNNTNSTLTIYYANMAKDGLRHHINSDTKTSLASKPSSHQNIPFKGDPGSTMKVYVCKGQGCSAASSNIIATLSMTKSTTGKITMTNQASKHYQWVKTSRGSQDANMGLSTMN